MKGKRLLLLSKRLVLLLHLRHLSLKRQELFWERRVLLS